MEQDKNVEQDKNAEQDLGFKPKLLFVFLTLFWKCVIIKV